MSVRLPVDLYEKLRREAFDRRVYMNSLIADALSLHLNEAAVTVLAKNPNQAQRLRWLVRDHGSVGEPFPNNVHPTWHVCEGSQPVDPHDVVSVGVRVVDGNGEGA